MKEDTRKYEFRRVSKEEAARLIERHLGKERVTELKEEIESATEVLLYKDVEEFGSKTVLLVPANVEYKRILLNDRYDDDTGTTQSMQLYLLYY